MGVHYIIGAHTKNNKIKMYIHVKFGVHKGFLE